MVLNTSMFLAYKINSRYTEGAQASEYMIGTAVFGIIFDQLGGSISLVTSQKKVIRLFGLNSEIFDVEVAGQQM